MKKIACFLTVLALSGVGLHAQSTNLAPVALTAPPVARPIQQIAPVTLDAAHSAQFLANLAVSVTLPTGTIPLSGGYRVAYGVGGVPIVTVFGTVKPVAPVTTQ